MRPRVKRALLQKKIPQISPQRCLAQRDAASIRASEFNRDTFRLFGSNNFEPAALTQEGELLFEGSGIDPI